MTEPQATVDFSVEEYASAEYPAPLESSLFLNTLIIFDTTTILENIKGGTENRPAFIPYEKANSYIHMMVRSDRGVNPGAALKIKATQGDTIRWRETTLTRGAEHFAVLYQYVYHSGSRDALGPPTVRLLKDVKVPLPDKSGKIGFQTINDYFWEAVAENKGNVTYFFRFKILGRNADTLGFYYWDPTVEVT